MTIFLIILAIAVAILAVMTKLRGQSAASGNIHSKPILTDNEREFFHRLQRALPDFHIFPQVAANAILQVKQSDSKKHYHSMRNRFAQKHMDFVVCELESLAIKAIIELDDRTHTPANDKKRDALFEAAGYRVIRFHSKRKPSEAEIVARVIVSEIPPAFPASIQDEPVFLQTELPAKPETKW